MAQNDLAGMLLEGRGLPSAAPDEAGAERWLKESAGQGFYRAMVGLAVLWGDIGRYREIWGDMARYRSGWPSCALAARGRRRRCRGCGGRRSSGQTRRRAGRMSRSSEQE